jgi:hypothetical protein
MSLVKRGKTWHTHFYVDGQRFRQSLETSDWRESQKNEKELIARASQGKLAPLSQQFSKLTLKEAGEKNLAERSAHLATRSVQTERERLKPLCSVFGPVKVHRITVEMVRTYVADRKAANVANKTINLELEWKTNCRSRVKGCDGVIALISKNTANADGELWEIKCADEEGVPTMLMWINDERPKLPAALGGRRINVWSWDNLETFVGKL